MSLIPRRPLLPILLLISILALPVPAEGQSWREQPAPDRELSAEEKSRSMTGAARAGLVALLFAFLIYLFTQDGVLTAVGTFFVFLGTTTHLLLGLLVGGAAVYMAYQARK